MESVFLRFGMEQPRLQVPGRGIDTDLAQTVQGTERSCCRGCPPREVVKMVVVCGASRQAGSEISILYNDVLYFTLNSRRLVCEGHWWRLVDPTLHECG